MGLVTAATTVADARCWLSYVEDVREALARGGPQLQAQLLEGLVPVPAALDDLLDRVAVVAGRGVDEPVAIGLHDEALLAPLVFALVAVQVWATALARDGALPAAPPPGAWRFLHALEDAAGLTGRAARALSAMGLAVVVAPDVVTVGTASAARWRGADDQLSSGDGTVGVPVWAVVRTASATAGAMAALKTLGTM